MDTALIEHFLTFLAVNINLILAALLLCGFIAILAFFLPKTKKQGKVPDAEFEPEEEEKEVQREIPERLLAALDREGAIPADREREITDWRRKYAEVTAFLAAEGGEAAKVGALLAGDQLEKAADTLEWMIASDRARMADHYFYRGRVLELMLDREGGVAMYREAHRLSPDNHLFGIALASALAQRGLMAESSELFAAFLPKLRKLADFNPEAYQADFASALAGLAEFHRDSGRLVEAADAFKEAIERYDALSRQNHSFTPPLIDVLLKAGAFFKEAENAVGAENSYRMALAQLNSLEASARQGADFSTALALNNLGTVLKETKRLAEAEEAFISALSLRRTLTTGNPALHGPGLASTLNNLGNTYKDMGRNAEAEAILRDALLRYRELAAANPAVYLPNLAAVLNNLGMIMAQTGRSGQAEEFYRSAVECCGDEKAGPSVCRHYLSSALNNLGNLYNGLSRAGEAKIHYQRALKLRRALARENPNSHLHEVAATLNNLAALGVAEKDYAEAEKNYREALEIYRRYAQMNPAAFEPLVRVVEKNLEILPNRH